MTVFNWQFVQHTRSNKKTGQTYSKLVIWLCKGNKPLRNTQDIINALKAEERLIEDGHTIDGPTIAQFYDDQLDKYNSSDPSQYKDKVPRISAKEFNKWKSKDKVTKQMSF